MSEDFQLSEKFYYQSIVAWFGIRIFIRNIIIKDLHRKFCLMMIIMIINEDIFKLFDDDDD